MRPEEYILTVKEKFGTQSAKDGQLIRDMNDFQLLDKMLKRYPGDRNRIDPEALEAFYSVNDPSKKPPPPPPKTKVQTRLDELTGGVMEAFNKRKQEYGEALDRDQNIASDIVQGVGQVAGFAGDVAFEGIKAASPEFVREGAGKAAEFIGEQQIVQDAAGAYGDWKEENPEFAGNVEAVGNIAGFIPGAGVGIKGAKIAGEVGEALVKTAPGGARRVTNAVSEAFTPSEAAVDKYITQSFNKAVKPSVAGKNTVGKSDRYDTQARDAVKTIASNKENLKFVTPDGDEVAGLPTNLRQFAESVDQTKKSVFDQYSKLAREAGEAGAEVNLGNVAKELDAVVENKALNISNPEAVNYAKSIKERLERGGSVDAETAEQLIKNYNSSLESFYRNPSYDTASRAAIDAAVVNNIRKDLDSVIESLTGEKYQALKNQYSALKAIEKDVVKRANMDARKNSVGLIDYADIFSAGDIVGGILSLNPALFAKGVAQKGVKDFLKFMNDPNRAIKKMFEKTQVETLP